MQALKRTILSFMLLVLFVVYQANIITNVHTHYVNGIVLTHSHPNQGDHTHSNAEISLLSRLSVFYALKVSNNTYSSYQQSVFYVLEAEQATTLISDIYWESAALRAPPFCFL